jgi:putative tricarboxylic transport membrane protein
VFRSGCAYQQATPFLSLKKGNINLKAKNFKRQDVIIGAILAFLSAVIYLLIRSSELHSVSRGEVGLSPAFFPELAFIFIFISSCILAILSYYKPHERQQSEISKPFDTSQMKLVGTIVFILLLYIILINIIGYYISSFVVLVTLFWVFRVKSWYKILPISIGLMVMVFFFFEKGLRVLLPRGFFF